MNPLVKMLDVPKEPTCGQLDDGLSNLLSGDQRPDDRVLHVGHERYSMSTEIGQSELMGSIHCTHWGQGGLETNENILSTL